MGGAATIAFIFGPLIVAVLLLCGWAIFRLFTMMVVDRILSGLEFALILGVMIVLMLLSFMMAEQTGDLSTAIGPLILLAAVIAFIPLLPKLSNKARGYQLVREDIRRYHEALKQQPDVPFSHIKLAEIYRRREDWDRAIEHYQAYIVAHGSSVDAKQKLERCLERKRVRDLGLRRCPVCGAENGRRNARCVECGLYLKGSAEIMATLTTPEMMRIWKWLIVVFLLPGLAMGLMAHVIPPIMSVAMLSISVIATFIFLYGRMSREGG